MKKIGLILQSVWIWVTGKYKNLTSEKNIDAAIKAVDVVKGLAYSNVASWIVAMTNTGLDDKLLQIIKDKIPKSLAALMLIKTIPEKPSTEMIQGLLNEFLAIINDDISDRQRLLTSLSAEILVALEDNKITFGEAAAIVEKYYQQKP